MQKKKLRREFIKNGLKTGIALPLIASNQSSCTFDNQEGKKRVVSEATNKPLKILILGGTGFLGPHQISYALKRGHAISIFTRGKSEPSIYQDVYNNVEQLIGDRAGNLDALRNGQWDVVIDNSGHNAEWTSNSAQLLKESCDLYLYTSSTGVYYPYLKSDYKEDAEVLLKEPEGITDEEEQIEYWYGVMKANSELEAIKRFGTDRTIVVRPTYMIGPADKSNRFIHWPVRLSRGGEVLVPGKKDDMVQYIDVRDVAEWMIRLIEDKKAGTFNAVGPKEEQHMYSFVQEAQKAFTTESSFTPIDDYQFLREKGINHLVPWIMPTGKNKGSALINNEKALANGLSFTPLTKTVKDTYDWWISDAVSQAQRDEVELDPQSVLAKEKALLEEWKGR